MSEQEPASPRADDGRPRRRVLVAFDDTGPGAPGAGHPAVRLARALEADLLGLFLENPDLARLAEHTESFFLSTIGQGRHADTAMLRRALKAKRESARRAIEDEGRRLRVRTEFRVSPGRGADAVLEIAEKTDVVFIGPARRPEGGGVVVAFDGSEGSHRALDAAGTLAESDRRPLTVIFTTGRPADARQWEAELRARLGGRAGIVEFVTAPGAALADVSAIARRRAATLLVIDRDSLPPPGQARLDDLDLPVLLVS
jgi:nucleotide-binding universal stress UspA family protein